VIVQKYRDRLLIVLQADHGKQTGRFAEGWGNEEFAPLERGELVVDAAKRHDNGWVTWDSVPSIAPDTEQPVQFFKIPRHEHVSLYGIGIHDAAIQNPYVGILVSMHGAGLYNDRYGTWRFKEQKLTDEERLLVDDFLAQQADLQKLLGGLALDDPADDITADPRVWLDYKLLQVWDRLSLQFLLNLASDGEISPVPAGASADVAVRCENAGELTLKLTPYPFRDARMSFPVEARLLPDRRFRGPEDFFEEYLRAPQEMLECVAVRG
jgi:hypothetical protein